MDMNEELFVYEEKMDKTCDSLDEEYQGIRAGRANPAILNRLRVDYYGVSSTIQQVANVIQIQPWEKSLIKEIEKQINMSDIGINPNNDGRVIRLVFPELTEERRKELAKDVKKKAENAKVAIRNIRRDANEAFKKMQKASEITEDELKDSEEGVQKLTDKYIEKIDKMAEVKTKEIMTV